MSDISMIYFDIYRLSFMRRCISALINKQITTKKFLKCIKYEFILDLKLFKFQLIFPIATVKIKK